MRQIGREPIRIASAGREAANPMDGVSTKTSGTFLNGEAGPKGGGQDARNNVVHRTRIQLQSAFKLTDYCPTICQP